MKNPFKIFVGTNETQPLERRFVSRYGATIVARYLRTGEYNTTLREDGRMNWPEWRQRFAMPSGDMRPAFVELFARLEDLEAEVAELKRAALSGGEE